MIAQIENQAYPVTVEPLHTVFSPYGNVQKIAVFEKNSSWQVRQGVWQGAAQLPGWLAGLDQVVVRKVDVHMHTFHQAYMPARPCTLTSLCLRWSNVCTAGRGARLCSAHPMLHPMLGVGSGRR